MTLSAEALTKRFELLNTRSDSSKYGYSGETWEERVTLGGREVWRSSSFDDPLSLGGPIFLAGIFGGSFSLWVVGTLYRKGSVVRSSWLRRRFRAIVKYDGTEIVRGTDTPGTPFPDSIRKRLYAPRTERSRFKNHPTRHSNLRPSPETNTLQRITCRNRDGVFLSLTTVPWTEFTRTWSGVRTPGYGAKKKKSRLPINNHSVSLWRQSEPSQYHSKVHNTDLSDNNWWLEYFGDPGTLNLPGSISHDEDARFQAIRRIIDRTDNGIEGNVAQDVVQFNQMGRTLNDAVTRMTKAVKYLRAKNIPKAVETLWQGKTPRFNSKHWKPHEERPLADNWLALQYGWKPLLQDVHGAFESLAKFNYADYNIRQVKGSGKSRSVARSTIVTYDGHPSGLLHTTVESRCKIGLRYRLDDRLTSFLQQTGFTNPINLFWEVLPYSFVVDWFLPIGPYLETLSAWDGLVFVDGFQTQFTRKRHQAVIDSTWVNGNYTEVVKGDYVAEGIRLDRIKITSFPSAVFPSFKNPFSTTHLLNGIALMVSAFNGGAQHPRND